MAVKTWYLRADQPTLTAKPQYQMMDGGTPPSTATAVPGWTNGTVASGNFSPLKTETLQATGTFGATTLPGGTLDTTNDQDVFFAVPADLANGSDALVGAFAAGNWVVTFPLIGSQTNGSVRIRARLFAVNVNTGTNRELSSSATAGTTYSVTTTAGTSAVTFALGAVTLTNEVLWVKVALETVTAGSNNTRNVKLRVGSNATLVSPNFTQGVLADSNKGVGVGCSMAATVALAAISSKNAGAGCSMAGSVAIAASSSKSVGVSCSTAASVRVSASSSSSVGIGGTASGTVTTPSNIALPITENFSGTDGATLQSRASDTGHTWQRVAGAGSNNFIIRSNSAGLEATGSGDEVIYVVNNADLGSPNYKLTATIPINDGTFTTDNPSLWARYDRATGYGYRLRFNSNQDRLYLERIGPSGYRLIGTYDSPAGLGASDYIIISLKVVGPIIAATFNFDGIDEGEVINGTDSDVTAAGEVGISEQMTSGSTRLQIFDTLSVTAESATIYQTTQAGDYSDPATWLGGVVPPDQSLIDIRHAVTVDVDIDIGESNDDPDVAAMTIANGASLDFANGVTMRWRGSIKTGNAPVTCGSGVRWIHDTTSTSDPANTSYYFQIATGHNQANAKLVSNGTSIAPNVLDDVEAGSGAPYFTSGGYLSGGNVTATYTSLPQSDVFPNGADTYSLTDSTVAGLQVQGLSAAITFLLRRTIVNGILEIDPSAALTSGSREIDTVVVVGDFRHWTNIANDIIVDELTIIGRYQIAGSPTVTPSDWGNVLMISPDNQPHALPGGTVSEFVALSRGSNPHGAGLPQDLATTVDGCVSEVLSAAGDGDLLFVSPCSVTTHYVVKRSILALNAVGGSPGNPFNALTNANAFVKLRRMTYATGATLGSNGITAGETYAGHAGMYESIYSCLAYTPPGASPGYAMVRVDGTVQDIVDPVLYDYNGGENLATGVDGNGVSVVSGPNFWTNDAAANVHGVFGSAGFVDPTVSFRKWDMSLAPTISKSIAGITRTGNIASANRTAHGYVVGDWVTISGATPSAYNGAVRINNVPDADHFEYDVSGSPTTPATGTITITKEGTEAHAVAQLKARAAGYTVAALLAYYRAGWTPTDSRYDGTGKDGEDIGAVDVASSSRTASSTSSVGVGGSGAGAVAIAGSSSIALVPTSTSIGSVAIAASSSRTVQPTSTAAGSIAIAAASSVTVQPTSTAAAAILVAVSSSRSVGVAGTITASAPALGASSLSIAIGGSISATNPIAAASSQSIAITGAVTATVAVAAVSTASPGILSSASGSVALRADSARSVTVSSSATATLEIVASSSAAPAITSSATGALPVTGSSSVVIPILSFADATIPGTLASVVPISIGATSTAAVAVAGASSLESTVVGTAAAGVIVGGSSSATIPILSTAVAIGENGISSVVPIGISSTASGQVLVSSSSSAAPGISSNASASVAVAGSSAKSVDVAGTAAAGVLIASASSQSIAMLSSAAATVLVSGSSSQGLAIGGTVSGTVTAFGTIIGSSSVAIAVGGTATATVAIGASSSRAVVVSSSASATVAIAGASSPTVSISSSAAGQVAVVGSSSAGISIVSSATAIQTTFGASTQPIAIGGSSSAQAAVAGSSAKSVGTSGSSSASVEISGSSSAAVRPSGSSSGRVDVAGSSVALVDVRGISVGIVIPIGAAVGGPEPYTMFVEQPVATMAIDRPTGTMSINRPTATMTIEPIVATIGEIEG